MKIVSWNVNYWENVHIYEKGRKSLFFKSCSAEIEEWINSCKEYIKNLDVDIILLQEINPFILFNKNYEKNDTNQYIYSEKNRVILYHELYSELFSEGLRENFWGNAIILNSSPVIVNNNIVLDNNNYYGRNGLMCYDILLRNATSITIINYYNKNNKCKKYYSMPYDMKQDLINITKEKHENLIIFAGDFNSDKKDDKKYFDFLEEIGFYNFTTGEEFITTMVPEMPQYPNDKVFINNKNNINIKISCEKVKNTFIENKNIHYSDHYPILCEITGIEDLHGSA